VLLRKEDKEVQNDSALREKRGSPVRKMDVPQREKKPGETKKVGFPPTFVYSSGEDEAERRRKVLLLTCFLLAPEREGTAQRIRRL